jgi:hypothetical protein
MVSHYLKVIILSFTGNILLAVLYTNYASSSYGLVGDTIYRVILLAIIYFFRTHLVFAVLLISYFFFNPKQDIIKQQAYIIIPHIIFTIILVFAFNELIISQMIVNIGAAVYSYKKKVIKN